MGIPEIFIEEDFKSDGLKRVVIATCALGMGINFPRVRYIVQYGPPKSIVDLMQQAGRGGRDGSQAHCVTYFTKRQLSRCGKNVKSVSQAEGCQRKALYSHFSDSVSSLSPSHLCCTNCRRQCACVDDETCEGATELFMREDVDEEEHATQPQQTRSLTQEDENDLRLALLELRSRFSAYGGTFFEPTASHGFTEELVDDIVQQASNIFTFDYLQEKFSIYSTKHVMDVLEVHQELFEDIPNFEKQMEVLSLLNREVTQAEHYLQAMELDAYIEHISDDSDELYSFLPEFDLQF